MAKAFIVALAMFNLFLDLESILEETSLIPASSNTTLTADPATTPLPGAGWITILALEYLDQGKSNIFNLGTGQGTSVKEIIHLCREISLHPIHAEEIERREGDPAVLVAASDKIKQELGWEPQFTIRDTLESAWEWHKSHPEGFTTE